MSKKWLRERKNDYYHRLAEKEGYRSRAAYKLLQIAEKYRFIKRGDTIVDLGAAPGGWIQAASNLVGKEGQILGFDIKPIDDLGLSNVSCIVEDVAIVRSSNILQKLPGGVDVVLSDLSPNISGIWNVDHARQIYLAEISLQLAIGVLRVGGNFLVKVFHGSSLQEFIYKVKANFKTVKIVKPKASRKESAEVYLLALDFKGQNSLSS